MTNRKIMHSIELLVMIAAFFVVLGKMTMAKADDGEFSGGGKKPTAALINESNKSNESNDELENTIEQKLVGDELHCRSLLLKEFTLDSRYITYKLDVLNVGDAGPDYLAHSIRVIRSVIDKVGCGPRDINFGKGPEGRASSRCQMIARQRDNSRMCYVESNLGYFFVHTDFVENVHVLFHRWD